MSVQLRVLSLSSAAGAEGRGPNNQLCKINTGTTSVTPLQNHQDTNIYTGFYPDAEHPRSRPEEPARSEKQVRDHERGARAPSPPEICSSRRPEVSRTLRWPIQSTFVSHLEPGEGGSVKEALSPIEHNCRNPPRLLRHTSLKSRGQITMFVNAFTSWTLD
ncbi:unnamed protein product [Leuciscus chuanchicus]